MTTLRKRWWVWVILASLLAILLIPVWQMWPFFAPATSNVKLEEVGSNVRLSFKLEDSDKVRLLALTKRLHLAWSGQDIAASLDASNSAKLQQATPQTFGLAVDGNAVTLSGSVTGLPTGSISAITEGANFLPAGSLLVARIKGLQDSYNLPGKEVFHFASPKGTLGVSVLSEGIGIVFIAKVNDELGLRKTLAGLKNLPVNATPGYSGVEGVAAGFSETERSGVTTYTLSQPGLAYQPTFGVLGGYLLVASSPEVWQASKGAWETGKSVSQDEWFQPAVTSLPVFSSGSVLLNLKAVTARGEKILSDVKPLFKLDLASEWLGSELAGDKLRSLGISWIGLDGSSISRVLVRLRSE